MITPSPSTSLTTSWNAPPLDGRTFYKVMDMDDATSGNDFGSCEVKVAGYEFSCDFETGECESTFFDEINDEYKAKNGRTISKDRLIGETLDAFYKSKDILWGTYVEPDEQMMVYAKVERLKNPEYYWGEDDCCPLEEGSCSLRYPEDLGCGEVEYDGSTYYLVEDTSGDDGEEVLAVEAGTEPDDQGVYEAVTLTLEYDDDGTPRWWIAKTAVNMMPNGYATMRPAARLATHTENKGSRQTLIGECQTAVLAGRHQ